jgi:hypothetical protein
MKNKKEMNMYIKRRPKNVAAILSVKRGGC